MKGLSGFVVWTCFFVVWTFLSLVAEGTRYDYSAYTECKKNPEAPLYNGGVWEELNGEVQRYSDVHLRVFSPAYALENLAADTVYAFSCWVKIKGADSTLVKARLSTDNSSSKCVGTVSAQSGCWSFLKGGFASDSPSKLSFLFFQRSDGSDIEISITSISLQPFSVDEWREHQEEIIQSKRKRRAMIHVLDEKGSQIAGAPITVKQVSKGFPFGSAIAKTILGNSDYQDWFVERFNAAVFENELKWYTTEPEPGKLNYTLADKMLDFTRQHGLVVVRGHNIFWEDPKYTPQWVKNLTDDELLRAVDSRIESLLYRYKGEFVHWDVNNEMLHYDFYETRLGRNASLHFFDTTQRSDPSATLFMNDYNVVETCDDSNSTVDAYVSRLKELKEGGAVLEGIGLEGHFNRPNVALVRAVLDKLATLQLPIWLTEVDISQHVGRDMQAVYLEEVLREGFGHPSVDGIMLWTAMHPYGCYQMCLTDDSFHNLPAGDVVDKLLHEWETTALAHATDERGSFSFDGFLGDYMVSVASDNKSATSTFSMSQGDETKHINIQI
ncbi:hypothetical protein QJS04_geneDACA001174 [Acorus gramineus]|uniref:GH10 domain-containing protein n=1 Tax=Acorus gramineus TaxID=55184 RepID=A0AAV9ACE4_ACOGR|nr:hypothetical protein QJS04_geneDACA001174 [Acorus gramineus]